MGVRLGGAVSVIRGSGLAVALGVLLGLAVSVGAGVVVDVLAAGALGEKAAAAVALGTISAIAGAVCRAGAEQAESRMDKMSTIGWSFFKDMGLILKHFYAIGAHQCAIPLKKYQMAGRGGRPTI